MPGFYQSPDLNPIFSGLYKQKGYTLNLDVIPGLPTVFRTTPTGYELPPGVGFNQRGLSPLGPIKNFFQTSAEKGKAYVSFIKTEKEAIIPEGTIFGESGKRFFVRIEGERVPIVELVTVKGGKPKANGAKVIEDLSTEIRRSSGSLSRGSGALKFVSFSSSSGNNIGNKILGSSYKKSKGSSSSGYGISKGSSYGGLGSFGSGSKYLNSSYQSSYLPIAGISGSPYSGSRGSSNKLFIGLPGLGFYGGPSAYKKTKRKLRRQPSLIAVELGIRKTQPKFLEETGIAIRGL